MSSTSVTSPFELDQEDWWSRGSSKLARRLCEASQFLRNLHVRMRFRRTSRAPLQLLRFQVLGEVAECDWLARLPDPWDADLSEGIRHRHTSLQALKDAIDVRALMFGTLPQIETAYFRAYRESHVYGREMIIAGCAQRNDNTSRSVHSLIMRAKTLGFRFSLDGDALRRLPTEEQACVGSSWAAKLCAKDDADEEKKEESASQYNQIIEVQAKA